MIRSLLIATKRKWLEVRLIRSELNRSKTMPSLLRYPMRMQSIYTRKSQSDIWLHWQQGSLSLGQKPQHSRCRKCSNLS